MLQYQSQVGGISKGSLLRWAGHMTKLVTEFLGRHLLTVVNLSAVDRQVLLVCAAIDSEGTKE